eukprot:TRINITY_DN8378_c0_g1_i1.p2 TRINITY_DN8378_c0_g1~~TRINITY_DN8378_c0_g1_i1.p2  ORF type:complete len:282 (-),score=38.28 TRINITY_DN8378_c0_g1_i1:290-1135(-)
MMQLRQLKTKQSLIGAQLTQFQLAYQHTQPDKPDEQPKPTTWSTVKNTLDLGRFVEDTKIGVGQDRHSAKWYEIWKIRRGYHPQQDRGEFKNTRGKVFWGSPQPAPVKSALKFPKLELQGSQMEEIIFPPENPTYRMALVTAVVRQTAGSMAVQWETEFGKMFNDLNNEENNISIFRLEVCDHTLMCVYPFNRMLVNNVKQTYIRKDPGHEIPINFLFHFGHTYNLREDLKMSNIFTSFVYLVDHQNRIRWKACGHPTQLELGYLEKVGKYLMSRRSRKDY